MRTLPDAIDQREFRFTHASGNQPTWLDRCTCRHIAASHKHTEGWNLRGVCLIADCGCKTFRPVTP